MVNQIDLLNSSFEIDSKLDPDAPPVIVVSHAGVVPVDDDDEFSGNENNRRVAARLTAEKERLNKASADNPIESYHRAGAAPGDLSPGGLGGVLGVAAQPGASDAADNVAQAQAWGTTNAAVDATKQAEATPPAPDAKAKPKGKAAAAGDNLLGDDSKPVA